MATYQKISVSQAIHDSHNFANPRGTLSNTPKTGKFTGYWRYGGTAWVGRFVQGKKIGLWEYHAGNDNIYYEFHCNL